MMQFENVRFDFADSQHREAIYEDLEGRLEVAEDDGDGDAAADIQAAMELINSASAGTVVRMEENADAFAQLLISAENVRDLASGSKPGGPEPSDRSQTVAMMSGAFVMVLRQWFSPSEWDEMKRRNATPEYADGSCCASHDFCDANEAMAAAFQAITGREMDCSQEADCDLWNAAWNLAKPHLRNA